MQYESPTIGPIGDGVGIYALPGVWVLAIAVAVVVAVAVFVVVV